MDKKHQLPWKSGLVKGVGDFPKETIELHALRVSKAATLSDLAHIYHFFTPALLYTQVRMMGREPFWDFIAEYGKQVYPITLTFDKPIFQGLDSHVPYWNYRLWGIEHGPFEDYLKWLGTMTFLDHDLGMVSRVRYKNINIVDPLFLQKTVVLPDILPMVAIVVVCLDTNKGCHYVEEGKLPIVDPPTVKFQEASFQDTHELSKALFAESPDPLNEMGAALHPNIEEEEIQRRVHKARTEKKSK